MRQVVLDTETTGLEPKQGHRIIEIGALELIDRQVTGRQFHTYINPERDIDLGAELCRRQGWLGNLSARVVFGVAFCRSRLSGPTVRES